jgi:hypothetical protein
MGDDILEEAVPAAAAQQVGRGDQQGGGDDLPLGLRDEESEPCRRSVSRQIAFARGPSAAALTSEAR